jgi:N-acetylneuraminate synthase
MNINGRRISSVDYPYIIAEMSANHNGKIENALKIISEAKRCGADAVKLQTYTADTITLDSQSEEFKIKEGLWSGQTLYELYKSAHMPWEWHQILFDHARKVGIDIFSSPFDKTAVDMLEDLNAPAYKIASFECIDLPLIKYVAATKKPMIISTGMADKTEISEAVEAAREGGCQDLVLLHCVSGYPTPIGDYNLKTMKDIGAAFDCLVGLSDHTLDNTAALVSVALGSVVIEKHFTLDRNGGGADDSFSMEPSDLEALCKLSKIVFNSLGSVDYNLKSSEAGNIKFRRSLYFVNELSAGSTIKPSDVRSVRPGYGLPPKLYDAVIGCRVVVDVAKNTPVTRESIDGDI